MNKRLYILLIIFIISIPGISAYSENFPGSRGNSSNILNFSLRDDVLYRSDQKGETKLYEKVAAISGDRDVLYYIRSSEERWLAGFFRESSEASVEFEIPVRYERLYKFAGCDYVFYYLAEPLKSTDSPGNENPAVFTRFNPDQMNIQSINGVDDFVLLGGKSVVLRSGEIDYNGFAIPLSMTGSLKIAQMIDSRIVIVSGEEGVEIVDLLAEKSIYQYSENVSPVFPEEYNVVLEFQDNISRADADVKIGADAENSIYYQIKINGVEETRTETGNGMMTRNFYAKLAPGKYHVIQPERWELEKARGRYGRMNNIYQPSELKIFVPENRILKIRIEFNGAAYSVKQSIMYK